MGLRDRIWSLEKFSLSVTLLSFDEPFDEDDYHLFKSSPFISRPQERLARSRPAEMSGPAESEGTVRPGNLQRLPGRKFYL
jgi:hypothetical protein